MRCCKVVIDGKTCILWAFLLLILPLRWMIAFFLASTVHELFHLAVLAIFHKPLLQLRIGPGGMKMEIPQLGYAQELLCAMAGPVGGMFLLFLGKWYPELALCALAQSCYNLIPVYPLDGGRILKCFVNIVVPDFAERICTGVEVLIFLGLLSASILLKWGLMAIFLVLVLVLKTGFGKIPCKPSFLRVQ